MCAAEAWYLCLKMFSRNFSVVLFNKYILINPPLIMEMLLRASKFGCPSDKILLNGSAKTVYILSSLLGNVYPSIPLRSAAMPFLSKYRICTNWIRDYTPSLLISHAPLFGSATMPPALLIPHPPLFWSATMSLHM